MQLSEMSIRRPVMTTMLTATIIALGIFGYRLLPVSALPKVDFPTIAITATLPGASPDTMAASVAGPIERQLSTVPGISSMSSQSSQGTTSITIQFDLDRNIDAAALDVQTALTIAQRRLPIEMTTPPSFRKVNPSDFPVLFVALSSATLPLSTVHEYGDIYIGQALSQISGVAQVQIFGGQKFAVRVQADPEAAAARGLSMEDIRNGGRAGQFDHAGRHAERAQPERHAAGVRAARQGRPLSRSGGCLAQRRAGQARRGRQDLRQRRERQDGHLVQRQPGDRAGDSEAAGRQHGRGGRRGSRPPAGAAGATAAVDRGQRDHGPVDLDPAVGVRRAGDAG